MVANLLKFCLRHRWVPLVAAILLCGLGWYSWLQLKLEAYPDISDPQVVVVTTFPGHSAEEVEQQITVPIERALNNVPHVITRRSRTIFGLSVVELNFEDTTNDYFARQLVLEKLKDATLPDGITSSLGPLTPGIGELYRFQLRGVAVDSAGATETSTENQLKLRETMDWVVSPRLLQAPGVADVTIFGGLVKQYRIELDPLALEKYGVTVSQIGQAVASNNQNGGGAVVDNLEQSLVVRGEGLIRTMKDIENVVVTSSKGVPVYVHDIGHVIIHPAPRTGVLGVNDRPGGTEGIVLMRRWENPSDVLKAIKTAVDDLNGNRLPKGVRIEPLYDRTDLVGNTLHTVSHTLKEAMAIVVGVLLLFLLDVKAAILCAVTIPVSLLIAFVLMQLTGIPANLLSLGAIDFGVLVDGTLVLVERMIRGFSHGEHEKPESGGPMGMIKTSALEVERPIFFSLLIIMSAYIPLFSLERVERRLFSPMAYTICYALLGSMIVALLLVPVLATFFFSRGAAHRENPVVEWLLRQYEKTVRFGLQFPVLVVSLATACVVGSIVLAGHLGSEFLPQLDEGVVWIRANLTPGISLKRSSEIASKIRALIAQSAEVKDIVSQSGRNDSGTDPFGPNRNEMLVTLKPYDTWAPGRRKSDLIEELSKRLNSSVPGANFIFTQPIIDTSTEMATGSSADLAVIIGGPDLVVLRGLADRVREILKSVEGAADTSIEQEANAPQVLIRIHRHECARFGINVSDVQNVIELAVGGRAVSTLYEGEKRFDITAKYLHSARGDISALKEILVATSDGGRVPLGQLAEIKTVDGASIIARSNNQRQITVRTNIRGRDQGSFVEDAQSKIAKELKLPDGVVVSWGGQFENLERARKRLTIILPITMAIIFTLLFAAFGSAFDAALTLVNVPFSLVGGIVALYLRHINFSVSAAVGFISLFGVAVMSGVLYISEINLRRSRPGVTLEEAILGGSTSQFRPRLMLILVALLGLVPAAQATGIGSDVQRPLATVVVGGLLSTGFLTLLALPSLYYLTARWSRPKAVEGLE
ncbi:MAG: efflux RND transporter permease subunit [Candidatus Wallbacteria bacterium]|nr:efflux RND transporter permease subunit [Candidatus Wallbacteria bacterium]